MNPEQMTTDRTKEDRMDLELQRIAMRTHIEVQQREDIRRDLAANLKFIPAELIPGEKVYYWSEDPSKIKQGKKGGSWLKVTIIEVHGSMATVNTGTGILQVNATKLRRPYEKIDFEDIDESREKIEHRRSNAWENGLLEFGNMVWPSQKKLPGKRHVIL